jgi:hemoglobin
MPQPPTLYERLGGVYSIATVVDDFIDRIMVDSRLNANPLVDVAHHRVPPAGFKYLVTEMVCWAAGGPQKYTGRSMYESHKDMKITAGEWDAFMDDFQRARGLVGSRIFFEPDLSRAVRLPLSLVWPDPKSCQALDECRPHAWLKFGAGAFW